MGVVMGMPWRWVNSTVLPSWVLIPVWVRFVGAEP